MWVMGTPNVEVVGGAVTWVTGGKVPRVLVVVVGDGVVDDNTDVVTTDVEVDVVIIEVVVVGPSVVVVETITSSVSLYRSGQ